MVAYRTNGLAPGHSMIVCSCNVLSDHDVRTAVITAETPRTSQVYGCLGCSAQCGRCARTIRRIMVEALAGAGACAPAACEPAPAAPCGPGCRCCPDGRHGG